MNLKEFFLLFFLILSLTRISLAGEAKGDKGKNKGSEREATSLGTARPFLPTHPDPAVAEIHRQLQEILKVHETLRSQFQDQVREIQRITDQARAHQKLLKDLEVARKIRPPQGKLDVEEAVRKEKIRLIQEQTLQNRTYLENLQKNPTEEKE